MHIVSPKSEPIDLQTTQRILNQVIENVEKVIVGKTDVIKKALGCWMARGHLLLEDVPGTGKTILARSIAHSVSVPFHRVQFTPDLLPGDIVGSSIFRQGQGVFEFIQGPLFTTVLLADEINRATPRTQSALLEAMSEGQITAEGKTFRLDELFFTIATQNPVDQLGTFPLPEAQLDRFMMRLSMGYPPPAEEQKWLTQIHFQHPIDQLKPIIDYSEWKWLFDQVEKVKISPEIYDYIMKLIQKTRTHAHLRAGASPRAALSLKRASQAAALLEGLDYVPPDLVYDLVVPVFAHRMVLSVEAKMAQVSAQQVLEEIKGTLSIPVRRSTKLAF